MRILPEMPLHRAMLHRFSGTESSWKKSLPVFDPEFVRREHRKGLIACVAILVVDALLAGASLWYQHANKTVHTQPQAPGIQRGAGS